MQPVDVVLDPIGVTRSLTVVKPGSRLISIVGITPEVVERAKIACVKVYDYLISSSGVDQMVLAERLMDGRLRSHVSQTFPFVELPNALRLVESGKIQGRVVVILYLKSSKDVVLPRSGSL